MFSIPSLRDFLFVGQKSFTGFGSINTYQITSSALDGEDLYIAGDFSKIIDKSILRSGNAAFLNKADASLLPSISRSSFDGSVYCVVSDGSYLYVGGDFTEYNGIAVNFVIKINANTGELDTSFNAGFDKQAWYPWITCLALDGDNLYVGGDIGDYNGKNRKCLVKISKHTGQEVDPDGTGFSVQNLFNSGYPYVMSMVIDGDNLYIGGYFNSYQGAVRNCLVKVHKETGVLDSLFETSIGFDSDVNAILIDGNDLYVVGWFYSAQGNNSLRSMAKINKDTAVLDTAFHQDFLGFDSSPYAMIIDGGSVYVVGGFKNHITNSNGYVNAYGIAKINNTNGSLDTNFNPGTSVQNPNYPNNWPYLTALKLDGNSLYIGGGISFYKGKSRGPVIKIDKNTAEEIDLEGSGFSKAIAISSTCYAITLINDGIYVGGEFQYFLSDSNAVFNQAGMAKISTTTGKVDKNFTPYIYSIFVNSNASLSVSPILNILVDSDYVYFNLADLNDTDINKVYKINKNTGQFANDGFNDLVFNRKIRSLTKDQDSLYVSGNFDNISDGSLVKYKNAVLIDKDSATVPTIIDYESKIDGYVSHAVVDGDCVYVCGKLVSYNGNPVGNVIKIHTLTGVLDLTFVLKDIQYIYNESTISNLAVDGDNLYVIGDFVKYDGKDRKHIIKIDKNTGSEVDPDGTGFSDPLKTQDLPQINLGNGSNHKIIVNDQFLYIYFCSGDNYVTYDGNASIPKFFRVNKNTANLDINFNTTGAVGLAFVQLSSICIDDDYVYLCSYSGFVYDNSALYRISKSTGQTMPVGDVFRNNRALWPHQECSIDHDNDYVYLIGRRSVYLSAPSLTNIEKSSNHLSENFDKQTRYLCKISKTTGDVDLSLLDGVVNKKELYKIKKDADNIYVSGLFDKICQTETIKSHKAVLIDKVDSSIVQSVNKSFFDGDVLCCAKDGDYMYVGGSFTKYNGSLVNGFAKVYIPTGELVTFPSYPELYISPKAVTAIAVDDDYVYLVNSGSGYANVESRNKLTGAPTSFYQGHYISSDFGTPVIMDMFVDADYVYICGDFTHVSGIMTRGISRLNKANGQLDVVFANSVGEGVSNWPFSYSYVSSMTFDNDYIYIGGRFDRYKSLDVNNIAKLNRTTGIQDISFYQAMCSIVNNQAFVGFINGKITSIKNDGDYLYVGGRFGTYCSYNPNVKNIAKINKTTAVLDPNFNKLDGVDNLITTLAIEGDDLYVGGSFDNYVTTHGPRSKNAMLINKTDASLVETVIKSSFNGSVICSAAAGDYIYVAGDFTNYNEVAVDRLVKINILTGELDSTFNLQLPLYQNGGISSIAIDGDDLYIAGSDIYNSPVTDLIKVNKNTGVLDSVFNSSIDCNAPITKIVVSASDLYVGGVFTECNTVSRERIVKLDKTTGLIDMDFDTSIGFDNSVLDIAVEGDYLYVAGNFDNYKNLKNRHIAKINKNTAQLDTLFSSSNTKFALPIGIVSEVYSIALDSDYIYAAGRLDRIVDDTLSNKSKSLVLVDKANASRIESAQFCFTNEYGQAAAANMGVADGDYVYIYIIDNVKFYNGTPVKSFVKIHVPTGQLDTAFNTGTGIDGYVASLAIDGDYIYIGGWFSEYNGVAAQNIVKINKNTAQIDLSFDTSTGFNNGVYDIQLDQTDSYIYVCGDFTQYKGVDSKHLAKLSKATGQLDLNFDMSVGLDSYTYSLRLDGDNLYVGGEFTSYKGDSVSSLIRVNRHTSMLDSSFIFDLNKKVWKFVLDGNSIFLIGWTPGSPYVNFVNKINKLNGSQDSSFIFKNKPNNYLNDLLIDGDSLIALCPDSFRNYGEYSVDSVFKVDKNTGDLDLLFNLTDKIFRSPQDNAYVYAINNTNYGLLILGLFESYQVYPYTKIGQLVRFNKISGEFDNSFNLFSHIYDYQTNSDTKLSRVIIDQDDIYVGGSALVKDPYAEPYNIFKINRITKELVTLPFDTSTSLAQINNYSNIGISSITNTNYGLYVGGLFGKYKNDGIFSASRLIKLNKNTGQVNISFDTDGAFDADVVKVVPTAHGLYVCGFFNSMHNESTYEAVNLVKINTNTKLFSLIFNTENIYPNNSIKDMVVTNSGLYITGVFNSFTDIVNFNHSGIAKINKNTATLDYYFGASVNIYTDNENGIGAALVENDDIYIVGSWPFINEKNRPGIAKINKVNGKLNLNFRYYGTAFYNQYNQQTEAFFKNANRIKSDGDAVWVSNYNGISTQEAGYCLTRVYKSNGDIDYRSVSYGGWFDSKFLDKLDSPFSAKNIYIDGNYYYLTGDFSTYDNVTRNKIVKIARNGYLMNEFDPGAGLYSVGQYENMMFDNEFVYITGGFNAYNSNYNKKILVKVDKTTGLAM